MYAIYARTRSQYRQIGLEEPPLGILLAQPPQEYTDPFSVKGRLGEQLSRIITLLPYVGILPGYIIYHEVKEEIPPELER
jgi:hypothetical protein